MANELTLTASLKFLKGNKKAELGKSGIQLDVAGKNYILKSQTIGTSEEAIVLGDVATPGYILVYNDDATNYVSIRAGSGEANLIKVPPKGIGLFYCEASAPYAIANTAAVEIEYLLVEA